MFTKEELEFIYNSLNNINEFDKRRIIQEKIEAILPYYK